MSLSLKLLTIPLVGLGGASALIPLSFSNSSNRLSIYEKIKKLGGDFKEVKSRENGESDNSVGVLVVCLEEKGSDKKQVTFKWFKNYQDISPAKVKWLTSTGLGIVKVQLEEDEDGKEELFVPS